MNFFNFFESIRLKIIQSFLIFFCGTRVADCWSKFILYVMLMEQETLIESLYKSMWKNYDAIVSSYE